MFFLKEDCVRSHDCCRRTPCGQHNTTKCACQVITGPVRKQNSMNKYNLSSSTVLLAHNPTLQLLKQNKKKKIKMQRQASPEHRTWELSQTYAQSWRLIKSVNNCNPECTTNQTKTYYCFLRNFLAILLAFLKLNIACSGSQNRCNILFAMLSCSYLFTQRAI